MKNSTKSRFILLYAIISAFCLFSFSVYDYYNNNILDGIFLYLFFIIGWLISVIISIIYIFRKTYRRISLYSLLISAFPILLIFTFFSIIPKTSLKRYTLPRILTNQELKKSIFIEYSKDSSYYLVLIYKDPDMAFGDGQNILGLYTKSNRIVDECVFGEFPIDFDSWKMNTITLKTRINKKDSNNLNYLKYWIDKNNKIKDFNIHFVIE